MNGRRDNRNRYVRFGAAGFAPRRLISVARGVKRRLELFVILATLLFAAAAYAFFHDAAQPPPSALPFGALTVTIIENDGGPISWDRREVRLKNANEGGMPGVVRVMFVPQLRTAGEDGDAGLGLGGNFGVLRAPSDAPPAILVLGDLTLYFAEDWASNWFYRDGYFYYRTALGPGEATAPLLTKVTLTYDSAAARQRYRDMEIRVEIMADIIQADGGAPEAVWQVYVANSLVSPATP